ncbi:MAG TPA: Chromate resistance protein ChrB, partial [Candidatus Cybelea sp.]|nr:Chromate resistance protein ChrB [Candidatus Cybelea sp.]
MLRQQGSATWLLLVTSLPGNHGALRLRFWRALKATGAAVLRDGVYLAPAVDGVRAVFDDQAGEIVASGGSAFVLNIPELPERDAPALTALFDRSTQYETLVEAAGDFARDIANKNEIEARRALRQLTREFLQLEATDFFPAQARDDAKAAVTAAEQALTSCFSPDEPTSVHASVPRL